MHESFDGYGSVDQRISNELMALAAGRLPARDGGRPLRGTPVPPPAAGSRLGMPAVPAVSSSAPTGRATASSIPAVGPCEPHGAAT